MCKPQVILTMLAAVLTVPAVLPAASPRPLRKEVPVVLLLPQIEELEETSRIEKASAASSSNENRIASRESFPAARQFWRRLRHVSEPRQAVPPEQEVAEQSKPRREVVTVSDLQLEPIAETPATHEHRPVPALSLPHPAASSNRDNLGRSNPDLGNPPAGLILPEAEGARIVLDPACDGPCDESFSESSTSEVTPRSHKLGSRLRFPHLSSLFD